MIKKTSLAALILAAGCVAPAPRRQVDAAAAAALSLEQAKEIIQRGYRSTESVNFLDTGVLRVIEFGPNSMRYLKYTKGVKSQDKAICPYEQLQPNLNQTPNETFSAGPYKGQPAYDANSGGPGTCMRFDMALTSPEEAARVAAAMLRFRNSTRAEREQWRKTEESWFEGVAKAYRSVNKPEPGEDVRRFKVQGLSAIKDGRFADAAALFEDGLKIAPYWPTGRYNAALALGEIRYFDEAVDHMKKYLALVPDAPDARQAQDKIYEWEGAAR